jgi:hypothetical protein
MVLVSAIWHQSRGPDWALRYAAEQQNFHRGGRGGAVVATGDTIAVLSYLRRGCIHGIQILPGSNIRQQTSADVGMRQHACLVKPYETHALQEAVTRACLRCFSRTSAYVSTRQHTSAYVSIRQHTSAYVSMRQHTSAYVSIRRLY